MRPSRGAVSVGQCSKSESDVVSYSDRQKLAVATSLMAELIQVQAMLYSYEIIVYLFYQRLFRRLEADCNASLLAT